MATVLLMLALAGSPSSAPPDGIRWVGNFEEALEQARLRNAVVFLTIHRDGDRKCQVQRRATFANPRFVRIAREELICVVAHWGAAKGERHEPEPARDRRSGAIIYRCPLYAGIECTEHETLYRQLTETYPAEEFPATYLLDPEGEVLVGPEGFSPLAKFAIQKVEKAQAKLEGPTITSSRYRKIREDLDEAEEKLVEERYDHAIADFRDVLEERGLTEPIRKEVQEALDDINDIGLNLISEARETYGEDPDEGMKILKRVRREFEGLEAGDRAREAISELEGEEE